MKLKAALLLSILTGIVIAAWLLQADTPDAGKPTVESQALKPGMEGMKVYIDPVTGEFLEGPPQPILAEPVKDIRDPLSTSSEGLQQVPAPVGGGVMVDLQGRFQQRVTATVDDAGKVTAHCDRVESDAAGDSDSEEE